MEKERKKRQLLTLLEQEFGPVAVGARPDLRLVGVSVKKPPPERQKPVPMNPREWHRRGAHGQ